MGRVRDKLVAFFVTAEERELMQKIAEGHGMNFSEYARYCILGKMPREPEQKQEQ